MASTLKFGSSIWRANFATIAGRRGLSMDRADGLKIEFTDGAWTLRRLSRIEAEKRIYPKAATLEVSTKIARETRAWVRESARVVKA